ncbi:MAG: C4-type zinc ribbon domain-containing protein [Candidatus Omnitrophica bacterium]|nr:C4-type zinc ribbon domain-containing protein [Candidatus Omnitrophota bacterium]
MTQIEEQVKLLVELQELDTHIQRMEGELESVPLEIKDMEEGFKSKTAYLKKLEDESKSLVLNRKAKEGELEAKEGIVKKYQSQLYQIKTNKEYSALQDEIGRAKADGSVIEEDIIRLMDAIDAKNKDILKEKEVVKTEEVKLAEDKKRLEAQAASVKTELEGVKIKRSELAARIDQKSLSKYERLLKNKDGLAIVPVANEACQGCFRILPPQVINEIRMKDNLVVCDSCARILYIAPPEE